MSKQRQGRRSNTRSTRFSWQPQAQRRKKEGVRSHQSTRGRRGISQSFRKREGMKRRQSTRSPCNSQCCRRKCKGGGVNSHQRTRFLGLSDWRAPGQQRNQLAPHIARTSSGPPPPARTNKPRGCNRRSTDGEQAALQDEAASIRLQQRGFWPMLLDPRNGLLA